MKKYAISLLGLPFICFLACTGDKIVVRVGQFSIHKKDVQYRNKVIKLYFPQENRDLGLDQLIQAYRYAQILVNHGMPITEEVLAVEEKRIDEHTQMPELLAKIKAVFGRDHDAYRRVYILPVFAERVIYFDFFLNSTAVQYRASQVAQEFLNWAKKHPNEALRRAEKEKRHVSKFLISASQGMIPGNPPASQDSEEGATNNNAEAPAAVRKKLEETPRTDGKRWIEDIINPLKEGEFSSKLIDVGEGWLVVRYLRRVKSQEPVYRLAGVYFPKEDYQRWLKTEGDKIKLERF